MAFIYYCDPCHWKLPALLWASWWIIFNGRPDFIKLLSHIKLPQSMWMQTNSFPFFSNNSGCTAYRSLLPHAQLSFCGGSTVGNGQIDGHILVTHIKHREKCRKPPQVHQKSIDLVVRSTSEGCLEARRFQDCQKRDRKASFSDALGSS